MDSINLLGSEDVQRAALNISGAAEVMSRAAGNLELVLQRQQMFMDDWLMRLEDILKPQESNDA